MGYQIRLENFEGPFDLLFHLIDKNEVDIYDIPIAQIAEQYVAYIATLQDLDLEVASEFLVMAANLLAIKARTLLPKAPKMDNVEQEELFDPRDELVERLLEYKKFKQVAEHLKAREAQQERIYIRPNEEDMFSHFFQEENPLEGLQVFDLIDALQKVLQRAEVEPDQMPKMAREEFSIRDKMREINRRLVFATEGIPFSDLFMRKNVTRVEIVVTFLALLELIKLRKVKVQQKTSFDEIIVYKRQEVGEDESSGESADKPTGGPS